MKIELILRLDIIKELVMKIKKTVEKLINLSKESIENYKLTFILISNG